LLNFNNNLKNKSTLLIEVLLKTIDKMGISKTIQVLEVSHNYTDKEKLLIQTIVLNSCKYFDIDEKTLFNGRKNTANRINAIGVASVLLHRHCNISQREISNILKKDATLINRYIKKYQSLDPNFKLDAIVIEKMEQIKIESLKNCEIN
jgi:hypothetical protein